MITCVHQGPRRRHLTNRAVCNSPLHPQSHPQARECSHRARTTGINLGRTRSHDQGYPLDLLLLPTQIAATHLLSVYENHRLRVPGPHPLRILRPVLSPPPQAGRHSVSLLPPLLLLRRRHMYNLLAPFKVQDLREM